METDAVKVGATRIVSKGEKLVLQRDNGDYFSFIIFGTMAFIFGAIPCVIFIIALANKTLFEPAVLQVLLLLGIPALLIIWYLLADTFNRQILTCDRHTLHRRDEPIWFFNSPITLQVQDIERINIAQFHRLTNHGSWCVHYQIYAHLKRDRPIKVSFSTTNWEEIEFVYHQLQAYLPITVA